MSYYQLGLADERGETSTRRGRIRDIVPRNTEGNHLTDFLNGLDTTETWMTRGACAGTDPNAWFPTAGAHDAATRGALEVCSACPVLAACRAYAQNAADKGETLQGIWGGTTLAARQATALLTRKATA